MTDVFVLAAVAVILIVVGGVASVRGTANTRIMGLAMVVGGVSLLALSALAVLPVR